MKTGKLVMQVFSMIRFTNLAIICLSLYLIRYTIIKPILEYTGEQSSIPDNAFLFLVLAVILVAAGGYVINDIFDTGIDAINKPGRNKIGAAINRRSAVVFYILINIASVYTAFYFGELIGIRYPVLVFILCSGLLYFYSASYKKMFLAGNLVISILSSLTIGISILFDRIAILSEPVITLVTAYAVFALLMTLIREIIKDCEDAKGDEAFGANTLPLVIGIKKSRFIVAAIILLTSGAILWIQVYSSQWQNMVSFIYTSVFIQLPLLVLLIRNIKAGSENTDRINSLIAKSIMITGVLSMVIFQISSS